MTFRCDTCGDRFNSKMNLDHHRNLVDCNEADMESIEDSLSGTQENQNKSGKNTSSAQNSSEQSKQLPTDATGTICEYNNERGFGFVTTADITQSLSDSVDATEDVFFHISDVDSPWAEKGDRLRFTVVETDEGLQARDIEIAERDHERDTYDTVEDKSASLGFGSQTDDKKCGPGKAQPTNRDIESFKDDRKFR